MLLEVILELTGRGLAVLPDLCHRRIKCSANILLAVKLGQNASADMQIISVGFNDDSFCVCCCRNGES